MYVRDFCEGIIAARKREIENNTTIHVFGHTNLSVVNDIARV
jgi:hypothetical protein